MIKLWLFKHFFKNEITSYNDIVSNYQSDYSNRKHLLEREIEQSKRQYDLVKRIFSIESNVKILAIEKNKRGEELLVVEWVTDDWLWIKLYGSSYQGISHNPRIMSTFSRDSNGHETNHELHIDDIITEDNDIGNGSIAMKYFLKSAESLNIDIIKGELSSVDYAHFDRSEHFYKKFGFDVSFNKNRTSGKILKKI